MDSFTLLSEKYKKNLICFAFLLLSLIAFFNNISYLQLHKKFICQTVILRLLFKTIFHRGTRKEKISLRNKMYSILQRGTSKKKF